MSFFAKLKGDHTCVPKRVGLQTAATASLGGLLSIGALGWLSSASGSPLVLGSFGATVVLLFCLPDSPVAQPRNVVGGHLISALCGLFFFHFIGPEWWSMALSAGFSIGLMMLTGTVHPPGGANAIIVFLTAPSWSFLLFPTLTGSLILLVIAILYHHFTGASRYPKYW